MNKINIQQISKDATAYIYDDIADYSTNAFFIEREKKLFIIDTFCGPESMQPILQRLEASAKDKEIVVINTHAHWDHFWGNCSFAGKNIISHELCREWIEESWEEQIQQNGEYLLGKVEKCLPNITFTDKMFFSDEEIELFHTPGHTKDSISVFDWKEKILYVGDNLEKPIIHVEDSDINLYIRTIEQYLEYKPEKIIASHTLYLTEADVYDCINYLEDLSSNKEMNFESEYMKRIHAKNLKTLGQ